MKHKIIKKFFIQQFEKVSGYKYDKSKGKDAYTNKSGKRGYKLILI